jgi:hypothetical protein
VSQYDSYRSVFRDRFGIKTWIPAWRPGPDLRLGMAGRLVGGEFVYEYDLQNRGIDVPRKKPHNRAGTDYEWSTEDGVDISVKAAGQTDAAFASVANADIGFRLTFKASGAMALVYRGVTEQHLGDQRSVAEQMVASWTGGPWPKMQLGDVAITSLLIATWGFAFGASQMGAQVVLRVGADVGAPVANLGSIKGNVGVAWQKSTNFSALSPNGLVIGFRALELRQRGLFVRTTLAEPRYEDFGEALAEEEPVLEAAADWPI